MTDDDFLLKAKNENHEAMEKVINQYQKFVYKNSRNFFLRGGEINDLEQ
ncbi:helix-turn-helix domain-containing protein [Candidatus Cetobacterium colombiensis]|uniref:Helix-turn-helix domain-containing protein n=1 Tax=Candidatus Cetobacterium colombiensis TaxID=3073100 RepID=A0ABU4WD03_9FUSO|nr:helix-turn-helix domain-containing protein [Candidatus Cetobacterium colombiensis]MDX8337040.1 helix-turn-helix domain-containing protein [Candidatus Cetobacterium colombiensis]